MSAESSQGGLTEYIEHHLTHNTGTVFGGSFHWDSWLVSLGLGLIFVLWFGLVARRATSGVPGKGQAFVEIVVECVETQVKDVFHGDRRFIAPLALTIFMWVLFMNAMDLLPLDLPGCIVGLIWRPRSRSTTPTCAWSPTADVNTTFAMSLAVFFLTIFYSIKAKGLGGFGRRSCSPRRSMPRARSARSRWSSRTSSSTWSNTCPSRFRWRCDCSATCTPASWCSC